MNVHTPKPEPRRRARERLRLSLRERLNRMLRHTTLLVTGLVLLAAGIFALALYVQSRPATLKVAVGPRSSDDLKLMQTFSQHLARERAPVRLAVMRQESLSESAAALEQEQVDLAVVRRDLAMPKNGQVVAILRRNVATLIVPTPAEPAAAQKSKGRTKAKAPAAPKGIEKIEDLAGKTIAIVGRSPANVKLLQTVLAQYGVAADKFNYLQFSTEDLAQLRAAKFDAVLTVGPIGSKVTIDTIAAISQGRDVRFLEIGSSEALEQQNPMYESTEIAPGSFGGSRPAETVETIGVSHFLVAKRSLDEKLAGEVIRWLFNAKQALGAEQPHFVKVESPDTDKAATLAVHPGVLAYLEGEQKSFFERYSEPLYWGLMLLSFLGSGAAWLTSYSRSGAYSNDSNDLELIFETARRARTADSPEELSALRSEVDEVVERMIRRIEAGEIEQSHVSALTLAAEQARTAINDRRSSVQRSAS